MLGKILDQLHNVHVAYQDLSRKPLKDLSVHQSTAWVVHQQENPGKK